LTNEVNWNKLNCCALNETCYGFSLFLIFLFILYAVERCTLLHGLKKLNFKGCTQLLIWVICWDNHHNKPFCVSTIKNLVICNPSMCDYVQTNVACDYKRLPMQVLFKFEWSLVFFSIRLWLWPISSLNCIIFYNVFVFFTTLYIHLVAYVTKIVTC
jgi:hypothetical protein